MMRPSNLRHISNPSVNTCCIDIEAGKLTGQKKPETH
jgi:hypothetical protein